MICVPLCVRESRLPPDTLCDVVEMIIGVTFNYYLIKMQ